MYACLFFFLNTHVIRTYTRSHVKSWMKLPTMGISYLMLEPPQINQTQPPDKLKIPHLCGTGRSGRCQSLTHWWVAWIKIKANLSVKQSNQWIIQSHSALNSRYSSYTQQPPVHKVLFAKNLRLKQEIHKKTPPQLINYTGLYIACLHKWNEKARMKNIPRLPKPQEQSWDGNHFRIFNWPGTMQQILTSPSCPKCP